MAEALVCTGKQTAVNTGYVAIGKLTNSSFNMRARTWTLELGHIPADFYMQI